jgi:hypothetical protein
MVEDREAVGQVRVQLLDDARERGAERGEVRVA